MRGRTNNPFEKRKKEMARQTRKKQKAERRRRRAHDRDVRGGATSGEDPDIAGIVPGPQPLNDNG